jgi:hypothetical protein
LWDKGHVRIHTVADQIELGVHHFVGQAPQVIHAEARKQFIHGHSFVT